MHLYFILLEGQQIGGPFTKKEIFEWRFEDAILVSLPIAFSEVIIWNAMGRIKSQIELIVKAELTNEGGRIMPLRLDRLWRSGWLSLHSVKELKRYKRDCKKVFGVKHIEG